MCNKDTENEVKQFLTFYIEEDVFYTNIHHIKEITAWQKLGQFLMHPLIYEG